MEVYDHNGGTAFVVKEHVLALIDAHNAAQPAVDVSEPHVDEHQRGLSVADERQKPAPDAVAEAAMVLMGDCRALKTLTDYQLRHSSSASVKTIAARGKMVVDALRYLAKGTRS